MQHIILKTIVIPFIYALSYLPFSFLYFLSSGFYVIVYYLIGYRKKVVFENLKKSFPDKTDKELELISKKFYKHFCDIIFETIKASTFSKETLLKRCHFSESGKKVFEDYANRKQSIVVVMGHCANWEWNVLAYNSSFQQELLGVFHPLSNQVFNTFMYNFRSRFGGVIISLKDFYPFLIRNKTKNYTLGLIADQSPPPESAHWTTFLNQETAVYNGPAKIARKFNYPIVYVHALKVKRGYYTLDALIVSDNPTQHSEAELTDMHVKILEDNIKLAPEHWLWSHRRWKHKQLSK